MMNFNDFNISDDIKKAIGDMGFKKATPIQRLAIPEALKGIDITAQAQTGSGKTIAFAVPILEKVFIPDRSPQAIVLCPTRELCMQVADEISKVGSKIKKLKVLAVYGGQPIGKQTRVLKKGVHVVVGTPGRVIDHIEKGNLDLIGIETVVLDEADEMLEMGFREDIERILESTPRQRQTLLFSATIPKEIKQIAGKYQKDSTRLIDAYDVRLMLIFCNTKKSVDFVKKHLKKQDFSVDALHGDMTQKARDKVMNKFRNGNIDILVATDVAARGLDIDGVDVIINYDVPQNADDYTHRIGRTARAGKTGFAFTLVSKDEIPRFNNIKKSNRGIVEKKVPTPGEINEIKNNLILKKVKDSRDNLDEYIKIIKKNEDNEFGSLELAAGLLKMIREN